MEEVWYDAVSYRRGPLTRAGAVDRYVCETWGERAAWAWDDTAAGEWRLAGDDTRYRVVERGGSWVVQWLGVTT